MDRKKSEAEFMNTHNDSEPSVLFTAMPNFRKDPTLQTKLESKLIEYQKREEEWYYKAPGLRDIIQGTVRAHLGPFKVDILETVLAIGTDETRDLDERPILLPEIVLAVKDKKPVANITPAITTPFVRDDKSVTGFSPDFDRLDSEGEYESLAFCMAYATITEYLAGGEGPALKGGTGLGAKN